MYTGDTEDYEYFADKSLIWVKIKKQYKCGFYHEFNGNLQFVYI